MHPRIVDRLQKRSPWFDPEDMPQEALERILSNPARYALVDPHQGARQAVRDILDDLRNGNRTLIDDTRKDRKQVTLRESIPDKHPEYIDPDDEVSRIMSLGVVSVKSAHIAIALASGATREIIAESLGVSANRVYQLRRSIQAELLVNGTSL
jgi:DNA-directed RNA polymerase specialized sigma24 family protein